MTRSLLPLLAAPALAAAYSFNIATTPRQCQDLKIDITGSGTPPYTALIIPFGPTTLPNSVEARRIVNVPFNNGSDSSVTFPLKFPENSQFVVVVSDKNGFGNGGTSGVVTVQSSDDSSCFDSKTSVAPAFFYHTDPDGVIRACTPSRIWWDGTISDPQFQGVIPAGQSFTIPVNNVNNNGPGTGFSWTPSVQIGTTILIVGGDSRGIGSAGSNPFTIQVGSDNNCLNDASPSSTPGRPAGGTYPTSTDGAKNGDNGGGKTNVGAIVGGVVGGIVAILAFVLVLLFLRRRNRYHKSTKEQPVDLLQDGDQNDGGLPQYYQPEPFIVPDPTIASSHAGGGLRPSMDERRHSSTSGGPSDMGYGVGMGRAHTPTAQSASTRKSAAPPSFRPVNIIQHDDAGPSDEPPPPEEPETIELPPAYTNIKKSEAGVPAARAPQETESPA